jgi:hypothetical protein
VTAVPPAPPTRDELVDQLVDARIAGAVATTRENNLANYALLAQRDPGYLFGLEPSGAWTFEDVLVLMAQRCGVSPDPMNEAGADTIDPVLTVDRLEEMAEQLRRAATDKARVLVATGHPTGLLVVHIELARALRAAGCTVVTPPARWDDVDALRRPHERHVRPILGVCVASQGANLLHTHSPRPMELMLQSLCDAGGEDGAPPGLVLADHGYAGAAGRAGITTVGFADSNDPALFVGEAEGDIAVCVPLDDNVMPDLYAPMTAFLIHAAFA